MQTTMQCISNMLIWSDFSTFLLSSQPTSKALLAGVLTSPNECLPRRRSNIVDDHCLRKVYQHNLQTTSKRLQSPVAGGSAFNALCNCKQPSREAKKKKKTKLGHRHETSHLPSSPWMHVNSVQTYSNSVQPINTPSDVYLLTVTSLSLVIVRVQKK